MKKINSTLGTIFSLIFFGLFIFLFIHINLNETSINWNQISDNSLVVYYHFLKIALCFYASKYYCLLWRMRIHDEITKGEKRFLYFSAITIAFFLIAFLNYEWRIVNKDGTEFVSATQFIELLICVIPPVIFGIYKGIIKDESMSKEEKQSFSNDSHNYNV